MEKDLLEKVSLSDNCRKLVNVVRMSGEIEEKQLVRQLKREWDSYIRNEEAKASNKEKELAFQKQMKRHRRTLGLIRKPKTPKFTPTREYTPEEIPVPCTGEFQEIAREAFLSGVIESKKVGNENVIYYTGKLI